MPEPTKPLHLFMSVDAIGGVWTYALDLAAGLAKHRISVTLGVVGPRPAASQVAQARGIDSLNLIMTDAALDWSGAGLDCVRAAGERLAGLADEVRADVVQLNCAAYGAAQFSAPLIVACHSCVATWFASVRDAAAPEPHAAIARLAGQGLRRADKIVAPSHAFALATARQYKLAREPRVVFNGRPKSTSALSDAVANYVFCCGRLWDEAKNFALLDTCAIDLDWPVLAAGPRLGPNGAAIHLPNVATLGALPASEVTRHMRARPIFAAPSLYEPFGLAVLEAAQSGCALVLSDIPTFRELWRDAAIFVPPRDPSAWTNALTRLTSQPCERDALGRAAFRRSQRYRSEKTAASMASIYRSLVAKRSRHLKAEAA